MDEVVQLRVSVDQIGPSASEGDARGHKLVMDRPEAKGGENKGAMGGEHLLMALGGCFMSNLLAAAQAREITLTGVKLSITGTLEFTPQRFSAVQVDVSADYDDRTRMEKLISIAERGCIVANTLKRTIDLNISLA